MKIIIAKNFFLCTQAYYSTPVCLKAGAMEIIQRPQITKTMKTMCAKCLL